MRNLKRALSLALAAAMLISLMVVGASAASYGDEASINNTEAVDFLTSLGVVGGDQNGNYNPTATLTRAEFCVMIANALTGGSFDRTLFEGTATPFTDVAGHWGSAYIAYCYSVGVIAGTSATTFSPDNTLTAAQASAILLSALGYNQNGEFAANGQFELNVTRWAQNAGLYQDLSVSATAGITRDQTAKLIYNAMNVATPVTYSSLIGAYSTVGYSALSGVVIRGDSSNPSDAYDYTLAATVFDLEKAKGFVTDANYVRVNDKYSFTVNDKIAGGTLVVTVNTTEDLSDTLGLYVEVLYKTENDGTKTAYGMNSLGTEVVGNVKDLKLGTGAAASDSKVTLNGTTYTLNQAEASTAVYQYTASGVSTSYNLNAITANGASVLTLVDNDKDGKYNYAVVSPIAIAKVTYAGTASITAGGTSYAYDKDTGLYTASNVNYSIPAVEKDDYIVIPTTVTGDTVDVTVADVVNGKVTAIDTANDRVQVGGAWYTYLMAAPTLNSTYDFQLVNGYMVASDLVEAASTDLLYVIGSEKGNSLNKAQADVLFADGTRAVIDINKLENSTNNANNELTDGALYTYTRNSDSTYDVKLVTTSNKAGYDNYLATANNYTEGTNNANAKLGGYLIADDAVIFLKAGSGNNITYSVISGATLKTYASQNSTGMALLGTANGLAAVKVATMATAANFGTDSVYAYITSDPYTTLENGTTYYHYNAWTTDGEVTVKDNPTNGTPAKGNIITLVTKSDGTMSSDTIATVAANDTEVIVPVAITGFNGTDRTITMLDENGVKLGGEGLKYDANVQFLYVNTKDKVGLTGGEVALAEQLEDGTYVMNAYAIYSTETNSASFDALEAIVFDMNNDLNTEGNAGYVASVDNGTTATTIAATPTEPEGTITLSGTVKAGMPSDAAPTMGNIAIDQAKGNFAIVKITLPTELQGTSVAVRQTNAALGAYYDEDPSVDGNIKFKTSYDFSSSDKEYYLMLLEGGTATLEFDIEGCTKADEFVADYTYTINAAGLTLVTE